MADKLTIKWDGTALGRAIGLAPEVGEAITQATNRITSQANALGRGFQTGVWHDPKTGEKKGPSSPVYVGDVMRGRNAFVGLVHPGNYAAMKDNYKNNTLLKAK